MTRQAQGHLLRLRAEYISDALLDWAKRQGIRVEHIQPGKQLQHFYAERDNRTVRYAWLAPYLSDAIKQAQDNGTRWLSTYKHERPNMALGRGSPQCKNWHPPHSFTFHVS